jgi:hypothetical protein
MMFVQLGDRGVGVVGRLAAGRVRNSEHDYYHE